MFRPFAFNKNCDLSQLKADTANIRIIGDGVVIINTNKLIAKIASDYNKPNGQKTVPPEYVSEFMDNLDVRKIHGIGEVTAQKMYKIGMEKKKME